jgi:hypothetical protein
MEGELMKFFWESDDEHYRRICRKFLRWLRKNGHKTYKGDDVYRIGKAFGINIPIDQNNHLVIRNWNGIGAFVLVFDQHPGFAKFDRYKKDSEELLGRKIATVVICSAGYAPLLNSGVRTVLAIPFTGVFDTETKTYSGKDGSYSTMSFLFEEKLYAFCKEKKIAFQ